MSNFRRSHYNKYQRSDYGVQSDPNNISQSQQQPTKFQQKCKIPTQSYQLDLKKIKNRNTVNKSSQLSSRTSKEDENSKNLPFRVRKNQREKEMKLQNMTINLDNNGQDIEVGETDTNNSKNYIQNLQLELETLRSKLKNLQTEDNSTNIFKKNIIPHTDNPKIPKHQSNPSYLINPSQATNIIQAKRSLSGKFYNLQTPNSCRRSLRYDKQQDSTYYKWKPKVQGSQISNLQTFSKEIISERSKNNRNPEENNKSNKVKHSRTLDVNKIHKNKGHIISIHQQKQKQLMAFQQKSAFQLNSEWEIKDISDDFKDLIIKKLQIPSNFPMLAPQITDNLEYYHKLSVQLYKAFKIDLTKYRQKLIIRRFKNGVYFQLKPNKNIIWYFNGAFYLGDWQTDLPCQGQKNGFGFQYIPNKYFYLGEFKSGMRNGKGTIKILSSDHNNPYNFTAYDGSWFQGKPHGYGNHIDQQNNKYMGTFQNGQKTGNATILYRDGLFYQGQVKKGLKHGYGIQHLLNGDTYIGQYIDSKFQGHGIYKWKNGNIYEGEFQKGKRYGRGKWKSYNGDQYDGEYVNDLKHGWGKYVWVNGEIYQGEFMNDLRHGEGTYWHPNGKMGKFMWKDGQIDHRLYTKQEVVYRSRNKNNQKSIII